MTGTEARFHRSPLRAVRARSRFGKEADAFAGWGLVFKDRESSPAATLVGVQSLFQPHILIEVEAVAVVPV